MRRVSGLPRDIKECIGEHMPISTNGIESLIPHGIYVPVPQFEFLNSGVLSGLAART